MKSIGNAESSKKPHRPKARFTGAGAWLPVLLLLGSGVCASGENDQGQFKFSSGFDYSTGKYNDPTKTTILYIPYRAGYEWRNYSGQVSVSWISIDGPGTVIDGGVVLPGGTSRRESGIGDTWISLTYEIERFPAELGFLDVTGKLKIPTADKDKGLGTGEFDEVLQLDYMYSINRLTPMITLAYKMRGDPPGADLNNTIYCSIGADWRQTRDIHVGASLDYQQASVNGVDDPLDFFTYLNYRFSRRWSLTPYFYFGLSQGSPDRGGGIQLTYKP